MVKGGVKAARVLVWFEVVKKGAVVWQRDAAHVRRRRVEADEVILGCGM